MKYLSRTICIFMMLALLACSKDEQQTVPDVEVSHLSVGTWNVGHFNSGSLGGYQKDDYAEAVIRWRDFVGSHKPDILNVEEWNVTFDKGGQLNALNEIIRPWYNNIYMEQPRQNAWILNGIFTNYPVDPFSFRYFNLSQSAYYGLAMTVIIDGHELDVLCGHIPWDSEYHANGLQALKSELRKHKTFIFLGDTNSTEEEQLLFQNEEGYHLANPVDGQWLVTTGAGSSIDNVITSSNITISQVSVAPSGLYEGDHFPLFCNLEIQWKE